MFRRNNEALELQPISCSRNPKHTPITLSTLYIVLIYFCFVMTGFVCTNSKGGGEECATSQNVLCYECDSRFDPNCADPFDFSPTATLDPPPPPPPPINTNLQKNSLGSEMGNKQSIDSNKNNSNNIISTTINNLDKIDNRQDVDLSINQLNASSLQSNATIIIPRQPKKLPPVAICHGCCVKITSKMVDGGIYVKRTCTTNLQINFFMVGLVCMKESGDRGKMCFCDNDYCNGQTSLISNLPPSFMFLLSTVVMLGQHFGRRVSAPRLRNNL